MVAMASFAATGFAQTASVTLQNQENAPFYYVVDPAELADVTAGSPLLASRVASFFSSKSTDPAFTQVDAGGEATLDTLADGAHLLVGFFAVQDLEQFPVRVLAIQADSRVGARFYALFASPAQLTVPRGTGRLSAFARLAVQQQVAAAPSDQAGAAAGTGAAATSERRDDDRRDDRCRDDDRRRETGAAGSDQAGAATTAAGQSAAGTQAAATTPAASPALPSVAVFSAGYDPVVFTKEAKGAFNVLPIAQSRAWELTGTRITEVDGQRDAGTLRLALTVPGGFSEKVSYFLYVFTDRTAGAANALTLEIEPRAIGDRGACILWTKGQEKPSLVGDVQSSGDTVQVTLAAQPPAADASQDASQAAAATARPLAAFFRIVQRRPDSGMVRSRPRHVGRVLLHDDCHGRHPRGRGGHRVFDHRDRYTLNRMSSASPSLTT